MGAASLGAAAASLQVRLAHRVAELENLPYGLSSKPQVLKVRGRPSCWRAGWGSGGWEGVGAFSG